MERSHQVLDGHLLLSLLLFTEQYFIAFLARSESGGERSGQQVPVALQRRQQKWQTTSIAHFKYETVEGREKIVGAEMKCVKLAPDLRALFSSQVEYFLLLPNVIYEPRAHSALEQALDSC